MRADCSNNDISGLEKMLPIFFKTAWSNVFTIVKLNGLIMNVADAHHGDSSVCVL